MMKNECLFIMNGILLGEDESYIYEIMEKAQGGDLRSYFGGDTLK